MKKKMLLPSLAACAICALGGTALSGVASSSAATKTAITATATQPADGFGFGGPGGPGGHGGRGGHGGPGHGGVHSESVVADPDGSGFVTLTSDRGTVTEVSGSTLTIKEGTADETYETVEVTVDGTVTIGRNGAIAKLSAIKVGDHVRIEHDGTTTRVHASTAKWETAQQAQRDAQREEDASWPSA
ncbi:MAG: hypothetical protein JWL76_939 [Thermoleophilia bacterium]|nr:hypothetical protein [Thermoleophilia bacterium]